MTCFNWFLSLKSRTNLQKVLFSFFAPFRMSQIKPLDKSSVNRICSGQVIVDLKTSVKELIENAMVYTSI